jgi:hypothetical protein
VAAAVSAAAADGGDWFGIGLNVQGTIIRVSGVVRVNVECSIIHADSGYNRLGFGCLLVQSSASDLPHGPDDDGQSGLETP